MTEDERTELIELYSGGELPEALQANVETYLAGNPKAAADAATLGAAVSRLKAMPTDRPDTWFVERTLDRLLQEHAADHAEHEIQTTVG